MENIKNRILELMTEKNINATKFSKAIGVSNSTINYWLNCNTSIGLKNLLLLADFFNVTIDYLSGRSDYITSIEKQIPINFSENLHLILKKCHKTVYRIEKDTPLSHSHFEKWFSGSEPKLFSLIILADYLDITIDYLVGRARY